MNELPHNWEEIKSDTAFWDGLRELNPDVVLPEDDDELHEVALEHVVIADSAFYVRFEGEYGETDSSVNAVAGKYYVANWSQPPRLDGPYETADEPAEGILSCFDWCMPIYEAWSTVISHERLLKMCETAVALGGEVIINEVKHVRTESGLVVA